jgi:hypothetical protein
VLQLAQCGLYAELKNLPWRSRSATVRAARGHRSLEPRDALADLDTSAWPTGSMQLSNEAIAPMTRAPTRYAAMSYLDCVHIRYDTEDVAKLTVYIPDELLERARDREPTANTSQLVQRALDRLYPAGRAPYALRPTDADELVAAATVRLSAGAASEFERGYRAALASVDERSWRALDDLARKGFDLSLWAKAWRDGLAYVGPGEQPPEWWAQMARDLGELLNPFDFGPGAMFIPTGPFVHGYE